MNIVCLQLRIKNFKVIISSFALPTCFVCDKISVVCWFVYLRLVLAGSIGRWLVVYLEHIYNLHIHVAHKSIIARGKTSVCYGGLHVDPDLYFVHALPDDIWRYEAVFGLDAFRKAPGL
jgi:hypothetical protein